MTIQGDFYRIEPINDNSPFYDLYLLRTIKSKTNPRDEFQIEGYGMTLESAIGRIIRYAVSTKFKNETITLENYLDVFKQTKEEVLKEITV